MHFLYIIYSKKADRYYIGETSNLENRLQDHVLHKYKKGFTKSAEDWETVLMESFDHKEDALFLEKFSMILNINNTTNHTLRYKFCRVFTTAFMKYILSVRSYGMR